MKTLAELRSDALGIFRAALAAADPRAAVLRGMAGTSEAANIVAHQDDNPSGGRVIVVGAGKAGAPMAQAVEQVLGDQIQAGAVTVKYGYTAPTAKIKLNEAGHPLPDVNGLRATRAMVDLLGGLHETDLVICLLSGGGSALLELPVEGVTLDDLRSLTGAVLRCGATIEEMNTIRKHISQVKGGGLARLAEPARVLSLILSDVLGSPFDVIASGPTAPDSTTFSDALGVVEKYNLRGQLPANILTHLERGARGDIPDTPKADDSLFTRVTNIIVADNSSACEAAADDARARGYHTQLLSTQLQGEASVVGAEFARKARKLLAGGEALPACLVAGGETTVTVRGHGKGGRSQELALAASCDLAGLKGVVILAAGTDGTDGPTDAAGALADGETLGRAREHGLDSDASLANNDSYNFFRTLDDLIITGPTNTNVNDLIVVLIDNVS
jgi:glycerate 2-kinase